VVILAVKALAVFEPLQAFGNAASSYEASNGSIEIHGGFAPIIAIQALPYPLKIQMKCDCMIVVLEWSYVS
jgi:hypothetical protein